MRKEELSGIEKITPNQAYAWECENAALKARKAGEYAAADYYGVVARDLRLEKVRAKLREMDEYSDAQNAIIDIGLSMQGAKLPIVEPVAKPAENFPEVLFDRDPGDEREDPYAVSFPGIISKGLRGTGE